MGTFVVLLVLAAAVGLAIRSIIRNKKNGKSSQCGDCCHCGKSCH